jgi:hypothetical protein
MLAVFFVIQPRLIRAEQRQLHTPFWRGHAEDFPIPLHLRRREVKASHLEAAMWKLALHGCKPRTILLPQTKPPLGEDARGIAS